jgi:hypothetical protein
MGLGTYGVYYYRGKRNLILGCSSCVSAGHAHGERGKGGGKKKGGEQRDARSEVRGPTLSLPLSRIPRFLMAQLQGPKCKHDDGDNTG